MRKFRKVFVVLSVFLFLLVAAVGYFQLRDPMPVFALGCCDVKSPSYVPQPGDPDLYIETFTDTSIRVTPIECRLVWQGYAFPALGIQAGHYNCSNCIYWLDEPFLSGWFCMQSGVQIHCGEYLVPTRPSNVSAGGSYQGDYVHVTWGAATSPLGISGYRIFRNGNLIATRSSSTFSYIDYDYILQKQGLNSVSYFVQAYNSYGYTNSYTAYVYAVPLP